MKCRRIWGQANGHNLSQNRGTVITKCVRIIGLCVMHFLRAFWLLDFVYSHGCMFMDFAVMILHVVFCYGCVFRVWCILATRLLSHLQ